MAYDLELAGRIRQVLSNQEDISEKKMFGGIAFLVNGNMACGVHGQNLIVRLPPSQGRSALAQPHTRPFDLSGKPMAGWIYVEPAGCAADPDLVNWVNQGTAYARALPLKH